MAGNPHPVFVDGAPPQKANARSRLVLMVESADELRALDGSSFWVAFMLSNQGLYRRVPSDTTSADDGASVVVDANGARWKHISFGVGGDLFDAYGENGSPSDRDAYDAEAEGFTFWATDEERWYVRVTAVAGTWAGPFLLGTEGPAGPTGATGAAGADGADGTDPGLLYTWDTGTSDADPGAGKIRADNADLSAATFLYVSKTTRGGDTVGDFLNGLDASTNTDKGTALLTRPADEAQAGFTFGAITDATGYVKISISGHAGATSFTAADPISFQPSRAGDKGADGAGTGDVSAASNIADNALVVGDGGAKGIKGHASGAPGDAAFKNTGTSAGTVAAGDDSRFTNAASDSAAGHVELAIASEVTTGTDTARAVTPDALAGSAFGTFVVQVEVFSAAEDVATGDGGGDVFYRISSLLNGWNLVGVGAAHAVAGTGAGSDTTDVQIRRVRAGSPVDMLTTKLTIDEDETDSKDAAAAAVIDGTNDDVATGDVLYFDVDDLVTGTAPKGLTVELQFRLP